MDTEHPSVSCGGGSEVLGRSFQCQVREGQGMLSSQTVVLKSRRTLLAFVHLSMLSDPVQLHKIFKNAFSLTKRPFISWALVSFTAFHFPPGLLGPFLLWEFANNPSFHLQHWTVFQRDVIIGPCFACPRGLHQFAPESFKIKTAFYSIGEQPALICLSSPPLWWLAQEELTTVLLSAFAGWSHWHPIWSRLAGALPGVLWGRHYNIQEF